MPNPHETSRAKMVDRGIFSSGYVVYRISTASKGWSVERKFKEFSELRAELDRLFPGYMVPPLFCPTSVSEASPEFISVTRPILQQFLDDLLQHPVFNCSELVYYFLHYTVENEKKVDEFFKRVKLYSLTPAPREIEETKTEEGSAIVALTPETNTHVARICSSAPRLRALYIEYFRHIYVDDRMQNLNANMETLVEKLSETIRRQTEVSKEISSHYKVLKQQGMASAFDTVQAMFSHLDSSYIQTMRMTNEVFKPLDRQLCYEMAVAERKVQEVFGLREQMMVNEKRLLQRKAELFDRQEVSKWDLSPECNVHMDTLFTNRTVAMREILPRESKECAKIRMVYGFMCNKLSEEFDRMCQKEAGKTAFSIMFAAKICRDTAKEVHAMWCELAEKYAPPQSVAA